MRNPTNPKSGTFRSRRAAAVADADNKTFKTPSSRVLAVRHCLEMSKCAWEQYAVLVNGQRASVKDTAERYEQAAIRHLDWLEQNGHLVMLQEMLQAEEVAGS